MSSRMTASIRHGRSTPILSTSRPISRGWICRKAGTGSADGRSGWWTGCSCKNKTMMKRSLRMLDEAKDLIAQTEASVVLSGPILRQAADLDAAYLKLFPGEQVAIATEAQNNEAQVLQASLNDLQKDIEAKKREASEPYNNAIKRIREAVKPYTERIDARLNMLVPALRTYFLDQQRKAREEQERINRQIAKQNEKAQAKAE